MSQWRHFIPMCISLRIPWELGHQLLTSPVRTTLFAPAVAETTEQPGPRGYGKPAVAATFKVDRFSGQDFTHEGDGTLHCPAHQSLVVHARRMEADGSLRLVYAAASGVVGPARCESLVNGVAPPRQSHGREAGWCIPWWSVPRRYVA